ncbi:TPA: hypothetical protein ACQYF6_000119 [Vibrio parahaemolyticus]|nr:hypothetical protein [Vibrio parahaemolyticus]ELA9329802.1 hypothetical protein [Vibrio parahaemolyticus]
MLDTVTVIGLLVGAVMIASVCSVYYKHQRFGLGGSILSLLGTVLIGMSVWSKISINVEPGGGFSAELTQLKEDVKIINQQTQRIEESVSVVQSDLRQTKNSVQGISREIKNFQMSQDLMADGDFGPATELKLKQHLRKIGSSPDDISSVELVEKLTGKSREEAREYIRDTVR